MYGVHNQRYQPGEPRWRDCRRWHRNQPAPAVARWLLDSGSLTRRLVAAGDGDFRVQVLSQRWQQTRLSERRLLGLAPRRQALVREVLLHCRGEPWIFARSVMPARSLTGRLRHLRRFGSGSLGALLFSDPGMRRAPYEIARIPGDSPALPELCRGEQALWGRRSCFYLDGKPLMVSEIFLPAFRPWC